MDLSSLSTKVKAEAGVWFDIVDVNGDILMDEKTKKVARFKVAGSNSKAFKAKQKMYADADQRKKKGLNAAEKLEYTKKIYIACVLEWENIEWKGSPLACTPENVGMLFEESELIFRQVVEQVDDTASFLES